VIAMTAAIALAIWWNANTISHLFIHRPFFRRGAANAAFAALLTALLGFPQSLWRDRHVAHHRGTPYRFRPTGEIALQGALVLSLWGALLLAAPAFFISAYLPGYAMGLFLCAVHGHYEHAAGTMSHYGRVYNALCFNDGYHVEHHKHPSSPWWALPAYREERARASAWPAPLRWLDAATRQTLMLLERLVLRWPPLQRWTLRTHARAFAQVLENKPPPREIVIVGGGLFPRTALVLRDLLPHAHLTLVDSSEAHLERARGFLDGSVAFVNAHFANRQINLKSEICNLKCDLMVFPLSFDGDRTAVYEHPPARAVIVHDWLWRACGVSRIVSLLLLKRINLVTT